jgi:hypothetical protein
MSLSFPLPSPQLALLIRRILSSPWDEAAWPIAKLTGGRRAGRYHRRDE